MIALKTVMTERQHEDDTRVQNLKVFCLFFPEDSKPAGGGVGHSVKSAPKEGQPQYQIKAKKWQKQREEASAKLTVQFCIFIVKQKCFQDNEKPNHAAQKWNVPNLGLHGCVPIQSHSKLKDQTFKYHPLHDL